MKKLLLFLTVLALLLTLAACGEKEADGNATDKKEEAVETFDAGNITVPVPKGWKAFPEYDVFSDDPEAVNPDTVRVCKGGKTQTDIFSKPYLQVNYFGPDGPTTSYEDLKLFYEQIEEFEPIQIGPYTWVGFTSNDYGGTNYILHTTQGEHVFQVSIWGGEGSDTISLEDADVQQIIAGICLSP